LEIDTGLSIIKNKVEKDDKIELDRVNAARLKGPGPAHDAHASHVSHKGESKSEARAKGASSNPAHTAHTAHTAPRVAESPAKEGHKREAVQEEKLKRIKAEVALQQQKSVVHDLQKQLFDLKEVEQRTLSLRYGVTISRLQEEEKSHVQMQLDALGKESFGLVGVDPNPKNAKDTHTHTHKDTQEELSTRTTAGSKAGDTRVSVASQVGFKKGMKLLIGSGTRTEVRTLLGFGSFILDKGLMYNHPPGTVIVAFSANARGLQKIDKKVCWEFCRGILLEELIPLAVQEGEALYKQVVLNSLYRQRPMMKHTYTLQKLAPLRLGVDPCTTFALAPTSGPWGGG
jgi:hypothetical protein